MSQEERIIGYISEHGSITAIDAVLDLGILQLSARIVGLEKKGVRFKKTPEKALNRYGEPVSYVRYSLC